MDDNTKVSLAALDSALTHMQETNKRLGRVLVLALIIMGVMFGILIYFLI